MIIIQLYCIGNVSGINVPPASNGLHYVSLSIEERHLSIEKRHTPFDFAVVRPPLIFKPLPAIGRTQVTETFSWPWSVEARAPGMS